MAWSNIYSMEQLGAFLRKERRAQGMTQEGYAKRIGVSHATLSALENGRGVSTETLEKALQFLGLRLIVLPKAAGVAIDEEPAAPGGPL